MAKRHKDYTYLIGTTTPSNLIIRRFYINEETQFQMMELECEKGHLSSRRTFKYRFMQKCKKCFVQNDICKHNLCRSAAYLTWQQIKNRCQPSVGYQPPEICESWVKAPEGFMQFLKDMGHKPKPENMYRLARQDRTKGFSKDNCKWVAFNQPRKKR